MSVSEFRPSTPADGAAIVELCRSVLQLGETNPMFEASLLRWKYWQPWPTGLEARSDTIPRSHVISRNGKIVAHIAAIPVTYRRGDSAFTLLHPLDWAARPEIIGVGTLLLQKLAKVADGLLVVGGSSMTQRILGPLGYRRLSDVSRYAVPARAGASEAGAHGPLEVRALASGASPPELAEIFRPQLVAARSAALVDTWRDCPAIHLRAYEVLERGQPRGGFVLSQTPGQARLIDVWCASSSSSDWARVFGAARSEASRLPGVAEVVTLTNTPLEQQALGEAGFLECGRLPMFMSSSAPEAQVSGLRFQMMDGDAALLHHGKAESWLS
jgi:hypothetical protein